MHYWWCALISLLPAGHAIVSPASATCNGQDPCIVPYDVTQPYIEISSIIDYHPSNIMETNRQGIQYGVWSVVNPAQVMNIIYRCRNSSCENQTIRNDIGSLTLSGEYGHNAVITDLERLNSSLKLVYSINAVPISLSRCTYTARTAVTYAFVGR